MCLLGPSLPNNRQTRSTQQQDHTRPQLQSPTTPRVAPRVQSDPIQLPSFHLLTRKTKADLSLRPHTHYHYHNTTTSSNRLVRQREFILSLPLALSCHTTNELIFEHYGYGGRRLNCLVDPKKPFFNCRSSGPVSTPLGGRRIIDSIRTSVSSHRPTSKPLPSLAGWLPAPENPSRWISSDELASSSPLEPVWHSPSQMKRTRANEKHGLPAWPTSKGQ